GAIALQVRADDDELLELGAQLDDGATRRAVEAERAFLRAAGGGCRAPVGALATISPSEIRLLGGFATLDGTAAAVDEIGGPAAAVEAMAQELASRLSARRAAQTRGPRVLLTRPQDQSRRLAARLAEGGVRAIEVPAIDIEPAGEGSALDGELARLDSYAWAVVTSANGARAVGAAAARLGKDLSVVRWAAVGGTTAGELRRAGARTVWQPRVANAEAMGDGLPVMAADKVLLVRGSLANEALPQLLRRRGAEVHEVVAYETREAPSASRPLLDAALRDGQLDALLFASPSAVRGLLALAGEDQRRALLAVPAICIGPTTTAAAVAAGFSVLATSPDQDADALAELTAGALRRSPQGVSG
ncbi:MAG: uroporphyrinogen-III synthase, partial [Chloroflexota bacterium]|nr:uroporphyrinogen-III synthase [Chloroflexota bacterium]